MKRNQFYLSTMDPQACRLAEKYGLGLEITHFSIPWNLDQDYDRTLEQVKKEMGGLSRFTLHGPYSELFPSAVDPLIQKVAAHRFRQTLQVAGLLGICRVIFHGGYNPKLFFPCWYAEQSVKFWKAFAPGIPEGMVLCLENVLEEEPQMLGDIVRRVDCPQIRMCLDAGHAHAYSRKSPEIWTEQCADVLAHFHLHNNDGTQDAHRGLAQGTIPMERLLHKIDHLCPDSTLTLEIDGAEPSVLWLAQKHIWEDSDGITADH